MEIIEYKIKKEDTLESIAKEYNISTEELVSFHNQNCGITQQIIGNNIPLTIKFILVDIINVRKLINSRDMINSNEFSEKSRYRCEQLNISRLNSEIITLSASTYSEFLIEKIENAEVFKLDIIDSFFEVNPIIYKKGFEFSQKLEKLRYPITFSISTAGVVDKIFNKKEIAEKWGKFRDHDLLNDEMYKQLSSQAPDQANDIITTGNKEFLENENISLTLDKNLFYHIFFRAFKGEYLNDFQLKQYSQLFPNIDLVTDVVKSKVKENEDSITYRLVGTLNRNNLSDNVLKDMYDKIYKPTIKYNYTEFDFIYRITYIIDKNNNFLIEAKASIAEKIKNNFEVITEYNIKQVEV